MRKKLLVLASVAALSLTAPAYADGGLTFIIDGDTFSQPYTITNTSSMNETVVGFGITLVAPFGIDTVNGGFGIDAATPFAPVGGSDVLTGYTGAASFAQGLSSYAFTFNDFQVGESFVWNIDVDSPNQATVFGNELIGSTGYADFSNGLRGVGTFEAFRTTGAQFVINTFTPTPAVPEPATWGMMILGMGFVGGSMRYRTRMTKTAHA